MRCLSSARLTLISLVTACGDVAPPAPAPQSSATEKTPVEPASTPAPPAPRAAVLQLDPPEQLDGMQITASGPENLADREPLIPHPAVTDTLHRVPVAYGTTFLVLGFEERPDAWTLSADLDANGSISDDERVTMQANSDGHPAGTLQGLIPHGDGSVPASIRTYTTTVDGTRVFRVGIETARTGTLPGGIRIRAISRGGIYDHPDAKIIVDENGDGKADSENWLVSFAVGDGVLTARGSQWAFTISPAGDTLSVEPTDRASSGLRAGQPAPDFSLVASDGETHDLARYAGAPLLIDFWATWCAPCIALHPEVEALAERQKLAVFGISANDTQAEVDRWLKKNPTPWPSAAIGPAGPTNKAYGVSGWPSHALIDAEGRLIVLGTFDSIRRALGETL